MRSKAARAEAVRVEAVRDEAMQAKAGWGQAVCAEPVRSPGGLHRRALPVPVACTPVACVLVTCVHVTRAFMCVLVRRPRRVDELKSNKDTSNKDTRDG